MRIQPSSSFFSLPHSSSPTVLYFSPRTSLLSRPVRDHPFLASPTEDSRFLNSFDAFLESFSKVQKFPRFLPFFRIAVYMCRQFFFNYSVKIHISTIFFEPGMNWQTSFLRIRLETIHMQIVLTSPNESLDKKIVFKKSNDKYIFPNNVIKFYRNFRREASPRFLDLLFLQDARVSSSRRNLLQGTTISSNNYPRSSVLLIEGSDRKFKSLEYRLEGTGVRGKRTFLDPVSRN